MTSAKPKQQNLFEYVMRGVLTTVWLVSQTFVMIWNLDLRNVNTMCCFRNLFKLTDKGICFTVLPTVLLFSIGGVEQKRRAG